MRDVSHTAPDEPSAQRVFGRGLVPEEEREE